MGERKDGLLDGVVVEMLPQGGYRVRLEDGDHVSTMISSAARRTVVRIGPGDRVRVRLHAFDPTRGVIEQQVK